MSRRGQILVLALGNDILWDDAVGPLTARALAAEGIGQNPGSPASSSSWTAGTLPARAGWEPAVQGSQRAVRQNDRPPAEPLDGVCVRETAESGLRLMELLTGYDRVLLIDAIFTGEHPPGTVVELDPTDFDHVIAPSPHYAGLPEVFAVARRLELPMPQELRILAMEVADPLRIGEGLSEAVEEALPQLVAAARAILRGWVEPSRKAH